MSLTYTLSNNTSKSLLTFVRSDGIRISVSASTTGAVLRDDGVLEFISPQDFVVLSGHIDNFTTLSGANNVAKYADLVANYLWPAGGLTIDGSPGITTINTDASIDAVVVGDTATLGHPDSGVTAASYGDGSNYTTFTVDAKGHLTAAGTQAIPASTITVDGNAGVTTINTDSTIDTAVVTDTATFSLPDTGVSAASYGDASNYPTFTVDAQGRLTAASTQAISSGSGGDDATATVEIYANSSTGDDANDGSSGSPVLTVERGLELLAESSGRVGRLELTGSFTEATRLNFGPASKRYAELWVRGDTTTFAHTYSGTTTQSTGAMLQLTGVSPNYAGDNTYIITNASSRHTPLVSSSTTTLDICREDYGSSGSISALRLDSTLTFSNCTLYGCNNVIFYRMKIAGSAGLDRPTTGLRIEQCNLALPIGNMCNAIYSRIETVTSLALSNLNITPYQPSVLQTAPLTLISVVINSGLLHTYDRHINFSYVSTPYMNLTTCWGSMQFIDSRGATDTTILRGCDLTVTANESVFFGKTEMHSTTIRSYEDSSDIYLVYLQGTAPHIDMTMGSYARFDAQEIEMDYIRLNHDSTLDVYSVNDIVPPSGYSISVEEMSRCHIEFASSAAVSFPVLVADGSTLDIRGSLATISASGTQSITVENGSHLICTTGAFTNPSATNIIKIGINAATSTYASQDDIGAGATSQNCTAQLT